MDHYRRGRDLGEVPGLIAEELRRLGATADSLVHCASEAEAVRAALVWADDGDLLLLTTHEAREDVIALLERLAAAGWRPGNSLVPAQSAI